MKLSYLSLLIVPAILIPSIIYQTEKAVYYVPVSCGISALIIFINFPAIVVFLHSKPIYYDDLVLKNYEDNQIENDVFRKRYQRIFRWIISVSYSIMVSLTVVLWYFKHRFFNQDENSSSTSDKVFHSFIVLGSISGLLRIYYTGVMFLGMFFLSILKRLKKREQERLRIDTERRTLVELTSLNIRIDNSPEAEMADMEDIFN